ncbi:MAG TPA: hypothetical protein VGQ28_11800 [Thermoanaerobaculia bacterium]|jgi:hypothetical protein|nr:hypothetical protein [Thermoanaerobaculia bacterium]
MLDRTAQSPAPRHPEPGAPRRKAAVELMVGVLQDLHHGADLRPDTEIFGRRQRLNSQPWRRPRRAAAETPSTMDLIRRHEARFHPH